MTIHSCPPETALANPSPNFGDRRPGTPIDMILLHYTGMQRAEDALAWLCNPSSQVSSHYFVFEDGRIVQLVDETKRAWHAGESFWKGEDDVNSCAIGIEIANAGHRAGLPSFPDAQIAAVIALCKDLARRWSIPPERVLGHSDVSPGRKSDPGEAFPWDKLALQGVGRFVAPAPIRTGPCLEPGDRGKSVRDLQSKLSAYGYRAGRGGTYDEKTRAAVEAFQRHFRPSLVDGRADASTLETLDGLLAEISNR